MTQFLKTPLQRVLLGVFIAVTGVHLVAQLVAPGAVTDITQVMLMPLLGAVFLAATSRPLGRMEKLIVVAIFFSWLGDTVPRFMSGDNGFLAMVGGFLVAQIFYVSALWPLRHKSIINRPPAVAIYVGAFIALVVLCYQGAGPLLVPVVIYGLLLVAMAVLATGLGPLAGLGGAIFFVSDSLIALRSFAGIEVPAHSFVVMATYVVGQTLLVVAVVRHLNPAHQVKVAPAL